MAKLFETSDALPRTTEILRIAHSAEQADAHTATGTIVAILSKRYMGEMDLLRVQRAFLKSPRDARSS